MKYLQTILITMLIFLMGLVFVLNNVQAQTDYLTADVIVEIEAVDTATGYKVYYKVDGDPDWEEPVSVEGTNIVEFKILKARDPVNFVFAVTAFNDYGESGKSAILGPYPIPGLDYNIYASTNPDRSNPFVLDGSTISGGVHIFTSPDGGVDSVRFSLDGELHHTEGFAPFDFDSGNADGTSVVTDTTLMPDGTKKITAVFQLADGRSVGVSSNFTVENVVPSLPEETRILRIEVYFSDGTVIKYDENGVIE